MSNNSNWLREEFNPVFNPVSNNKLDSELFNNTARKIAEMLLDNNHKDHNKYTQLRRFYNELVIIQNKVTDENFEYEQAFLNMLNAKAAYAFGRNLVSEDFKVWLKACLKATTSIEALKHFKLHFEAVLGFIYEEEKKREEEKRKKNK